ncbi:MAG: hypothetical protein GY798_07530 [Hyphomicrobiales bacterium]|nr:hypothetical protein [Hyphomicrobiales bacterium]
MLEARRGDDRVERRRLEWHGVVRDWMDDIDPPAFRDIDADEAASGWCIVAQRAVDTP